MPFSNYARAFLVALLWLVCLEGGLRIAGVKFNSSFYTSDRERGYALRPNSEGWQTEEQSQYIRINKDGQRDRERTVATPARTFRIAVIGSSEAEARQVELSKTFEAVTERRLTQTASTKGGSVEVLNFGVPGYGLSQDYLTLRSQVWKYHPSVVILALSGFTILRNTRSLAPGLQKGTPFYSFHDGTLVLDQSNGSEVEPEHWRKVLKDSSSDVMNRIRLLSLINTARVEWPGIRQIIGWPGATNETKLADTVKVEGVPGDYIKIGTYFPDAPGLRDSFELTRGFFHSMKQECDAHAAEFWVVLIESNIQVSPDPSERAAFAAQYGLATLDAGERRVAEYAASESVPLIRLSPVIGDYARQHHVALHGFAGTAPNSGHWNELGHSIAAQTISSELLAKSVSLRRFLSSLSPGEREKH